MRRALLLTFALSIGLISACRFSPDNSLTVRVTYDEADSRMKASADKFDCYVVSVTGEKLTSGIDGALASCLALGKMSDVVSFETLRSSGVSLSVPAGAPIKVRLLGIEKAATDSCRDVKVSTLLSAAGTEIYELGATATTAFADTEIEIQNTFDANSSPLVAGCQTGTETETLTELTLDRAFEGVATGGQTTVQFNELLNVLPPQDFEGQSMSSLSDFTQVIGALALTSFNPGNAVHQRLDFLYSFDRKVFPVGVKGFRVKVAARGGWMTPVSACVPSEAVSTGDGYQLEVGKTGSFDHANPIVSASPSDDSLKTMDFTPALSYVTDEGGLDFFHLSLRSKNQTEITFPVRCSALRISSLSVSVISKQ